MTLSLNGLMDGLKDKKILLGITGGIAAYKSAYLISGLTKLGCEVKVIMTKSAQEFITPLTLRTLSKNKVYTDMFEENAEYDLEHINLSKWADFMIIAPATYNIIGKISNGIADDLLTSTVAAYKNKIFICPAMNDGMWNNPILKNNIEKLKSLGFIFIGPEKGRLACGDDAEGRMTEPDEIIKYVNEYFAVGACHGMPLQNKKILITAAGTREPIDPVRFISNYSSGKMGYALAREAKNMGADVTLISGQSSESAPEGIKTIKIQTAEEMLNEVEEYFPKNEIFISCAAVSDYRPEKILKEKIKKNTVGAKGPSPLQLKLIQNPDILKIVSKNKNGKIIVGFAAESNDLIKNAKEKLKEKNLDFIVANNITAKDSGFESDYNKITIINKNGKIKKFEKMPKTECAKIILTELGDWLKSCDSLKRIATLVPVP